MRVHPPGESQAATAQRKSRPWKTSASHFVEYPNGESHRKPVLLQKGYSTAQQKLHSVPARRSRGGRPFCSPKRGNGRPSWITLSNQVQAKRPRQGLRGGLATPSWPRVNRQQARNR